MRTRAICTYAAAFALTLVGIACSSDQPATGGNQPGQPGTGGGGDGGSSEGSTGGDSGNTDSGNPVVDAGPALCDPTVPWVSAGRVPTLVSPTFSQFGAVSAAETTLAWTASNGDVYIADRADTGSDFTTASVVNVGATALASDRVALSPTGKEFIAVASDRQSFQEFTRTTTSTTTWTNAGQDEFSAINALLSESAGSLAEPVVGADKLTFFFVATLGTNKPTIYESRYNSVISGWAAPAQILAAELHSNDATHRRRPTGVSSDRRTLFFYDEVNALERMAFRDSEDSAFSQFYDLTGFDEGAPNAACDTLYFQGTDGSGPTVFVSE